MMIADLNEKLTNAGLDVNVHIEDQMVFIQGRKRGAFISIFGAEDVSARKKEGSVGKDFKGPTALDDALAFVA